MRYSIGSAAVLLVAACVLPACRSKSDSAAPPASKTETTATPTATPTAIASATPSVAPPLGPPPVCKIENKKTWGSGVNKTTGLTETELPDGRVAIGLALGLTPHALLVGKDGRGSLAKINVAPGSKAAKAPKANEGSRHLMRVTPVKAEGNNVSAFLDFKDKYQDKRTTVACGPADSDDLWVLFDEVPFFERQDTSPQALDLLFKKEGSSSELTYHEIRDCRSFTDIDKGESWVVGSGLHGVLKSDDTKEWFSTFFVDTGAKTHEKHLHKSPLKGSPPQTFDYEVPVSARLKDGSYLLAARNAGRLLVGFLAPDKSLKGDFSSYSGLPTLPDLAWDGEDLILTTSMSKGKDPLGIKALRVSGSKPSLPKYLTDVVTDEVAIGNEFDPDFIRDSKGNHWLAHIEGQRLKGNLSIAPLDHAFRQVGRPYRVTEENENASSARLIPMRDGGIMVVFIRENADGKTELVTEELHCEISK